MEVGREDRRRNFGSEGVPGGGKSLKRKRIALNNLLWAGFALEESFLTF